MVVLLNIDMLAFKHLWKKKRGQNLLLILGSMMVTLLVLEIIFRIAAIQGDYHKPRVDRAFPLKGKKPERTMLGSYTNAVFVSRYDSNPRGYFEPRGIIPHRNNSVGWRDVEHTLKKKPGVFRILGLGDSYLWGQGVKRKDICLTKLPDLLRKTIPNKTIETINAGVTGSNTLDQRNQLKAKGLAYHPDLVIVHFNLTDVELHVLKDWRIEFFTNYTAIYQSPDGLSKISYLWSWGRYCVLKHIRAKRYIQECVDNFRTDSIGWRACRTALHHIKVMCDRNNIRLCVVIFPFFYKLDSDYPFQPLHTIVTEYCRSRGIRVLDLRDSFQDFQGPELWVHPTDQHPNEIAHDIAAREIAQFLKDHSAELLSGSGNRSISE